MQVKSILKRIEMPRRETRRRGCIPCKAEDNPPSSPLLVKLPLIQVQEPVSTFRRHATPHSLAFCQAPFRARTCRHLSKSSKSVPRLKHPTGSKWLPKLLPTTHDPTRFDDIDKQLVKLHCVDNRETSRHKKPGPDVPKAGFLLLWLYLLTIHTSFALLHLAMQVSPAIGRSPQPKSPSFLLRKLGTERSTSPPGSMVQVAA